MTAETLEKQVVVPCTVLKVYDNIQEIQEGCRYDTSWQQTFVHQEYEPAGTRGQSDFCFFRLNSECFRSGPRFVRAGRSFVDLPSRQGKLQTAPGNAPSVPTCLSGKTCLESSSLPQYASTQFAKSVCCSLGL